MNEPSFKTLAAAKKRARKRAGRDGASWHVRYRGGNYSHPYQVVSNDKWAELQRRGFQVGKLVYTAEPDVFELRLSREQLEHYRAYIETERPGSEGALEGGMFKTPLERGILKKLTALIGADRRPVRSA